MVEKIRAPVTLQCAHGHWSPETEREELPQSVLVVAAVDLVRHEDHGASLAVTFDGLAQTGRHVAVQRHQSVLHVDHEDDHIRSGERDRYLAIDVLLEVVAVDDADAAGIDNLHRDILVKDDGADPVARDPRRRFDDRYTLERQTVQQR